MSRPLEVLMGEKTPLSYAASLLSSLFVVCRRLPSPDLCVPPAPPETKPPLRQSPGLFFALCLALRSVSRATMGLSHKVIPVNSFFKGKNATAGVFLSGNHKIEG
jgi:hypothetical protein